MIAFQETYDMRKKEINEFIQLVKFLEIKKNIKEDDISEFAKFFYEGNDKIELTYQSMTNILKSNILLMLYNVIEYTVSNLIDAIYEEIKNQSLSYVEINDSIKKIWKNTILKAVNDPTANYNTFMKKNQEIIDAIVNQTIIDINSRNTLPGGNLDAVTIKETFEKHGMQIETSSRNYRPDIFSNIKEKRNNLAHGAVSFVDALRDDGISDIEAKYTLVIGFLEELIIVVKKYIEDLGYRSSI